MRRGRQRRQEKPQHLSGAEEMQGFLGGHLPLSCNQIPGARSKMLIPQPSQGGWDRAQEPVRLQLPKPQTSNPGRCLPCCSRGLASLLRVSGPVCREPPCRGPLPVLLVPGSCPLADPPWVMFYRGPASSRPWGLGPSPALSSIVHPPQSPQSPWHLSPTKLTSSDSEAACPGPASQLPPRLPPSSLPIGRGQPLGKAVIFPARNYRFGTKGV